ncbi:MAG: putative signal peptidase [Pseudomonadota bacterium]|jgi:signal peptidase I
MQTLTTAVLAAFASYAGAWYFGLVEGNFALLLFLATVVSGVYWVAERVWFLPRRQQAAQAMQAQAEQRQAALAAQGITQTDNVDLSAARERILAQPWWLDWTAGLFPVILVVFLLRSFLFEPFKIPSGSMIPTLLVGDLILVNKFTYGVRLPVANTKVTEGTPPQRGDVMVFRYPPRPSLDYIKRVVGVPGDEVAYLNKRLTLNGQPVATQPQPDFFDKDAMRYSKQFDEALGPKRHRILNDDDRPAFIPGTEDFPFKDQCRYTVEGVTCKVPAGHYFVMGDNRDNSLDSRFWGFVPDRNIVGKAFFVWMNFGDLKRIGSFD